jgi:hypothetical protein
MTTTVLPPDAGPATKNPLRILPIGTNLLPVEIVESRRNRKVRRLVLSALAVFTVLLAMWYGVSALQTTVARGALSDAESDVQRTTRQQRQFGDLVQAQSESQTITAQLNAVLASDLRWTSLTTALQQAAPADVHVSMVAGALSATSSGAALENPQSARLPSTTTDTLLGTLTIGGAASSKASIADYLATLAKVPGLADPFVTELVEKDGSLEFTMQMDITSAAPGGRYAPTEGK